MLFVLLMIWYLTLLRGLP